MTPRSRRIVALTAATLACLLTTRLGVWQLDRAAQKIQRQQLIDERSQLPPVPVDQLARDPNEAARQWQRRFTVTGHWLPHATVFLDNRPMGGQAGFYVVTPLELTEAKPGAATAGRALVVLRGWSPRDVADRTRVPAVPTPAGIVTLQGRLAPWPSTLYALGAEASGPIRQNLDPAWYQQHAGLPLAPLVLQLDPSPPASAETVDGLRRDWPAPATDVHKHYGYAFQWFAMSTLVLGLTLWFQLIRPALHARRGST